MITFARALGLALLVMAWGGSSCSFTCKCNRNVHWGLHFIMSTVWEAGIKWVTHHGGYINPRLSYDASRRQVSVKENSELSSREIDEGDVLMQIPDECLLSLHTIEASAFGRSLFAAVHSILPQNGTLNPSTSKRARVSTTVSDKSIGSNLYNDEQDVMLALFLAYLIEKKGLESTDGQIDDDAQPWLFFQPYLDTLPTSDTLNSKTNEYLNLLPRQWPIETIEHRLKGTSLYIRALDEKKGLVDEYNKVKSAWESNNYSESFPSLESYDMMMAAVTSRCFAGLGLDCVDVMIPMLDLLNHARGRCNNSGEHLNPSGTGVRYERYEGTCADETNVNATSTNTGTNILKRKQTSFNTKQKGGGIMVTAAKQLKHGEELLMTYGAKGNASLLGRYGFCLENNSEPDGE